MKITFISDFIDWFSKLNFKYKILIAGNYDFGFENENKKWAEALTKKMEVIYLNDSGIEIEEVRFWGPRRL